MLDFERALPIILRFEGGKVDDAEDPGGRTAYGVTQRTYDGWLASQDALTRDVWLITQAEVAAIYNERFWLRARCDALLWPLSLVHFDAAVNHGTEPKGADGRVKINAGRLLQRALLMTSDEQDGVVGTQTLALIPLTPIKELCDRYLLERFFRYDKLVDQNPRLAKYNTSGWEDRLEQLYRVVYLH